MKPTRSHPCCGFAERHAAVILTVAAGLFVTAAGFSQLRSMEEYSLKEEFSNQAKERANAWLIAIEDRLAAFGSVYGLYLSSEQVTRDEFHLFAEQSVMRYRGVKAVQWVPRVSPQARYDHEQQARHEGIEKYRIVESAGDSTREATPIAYFPICYCEPLAENLHLLGVDLASEPSWQKALDHAAETDQMIVTTGVCAPQGDKSLGIFYAIRPVYRRDNLTLTAVERHENLEGFLIGVFDIGRSVEPSLTSLTPRGIDIELVKRTAQGPQRLYSHATRRKSPGRSDAKRGPGHAPWTWEMPLDFNEEHWAIRCTGAGAFFAGRQSAASFASLIVGLVGTCVAAYLVYNYQTRYRTVEHLVLERTQALDASKTQLKRRNEFLHHILASLTHPLYVIDANDFTIRLSNQSLDTPDFHTPPACYRVIHGRNTPCNSGDCLHECSVAKVKSTRKPCRVERTHVDREGRSTFCEIYAYPVFDADRNVSEVIEYHLDVTERKETQKALAESEQKFRTVVETSKDAMVVIDKDGLISLFNPAAEQMFGQSCTAMLGKPLDSIIPEDVRPHHPEHVASYFRTGKPDNAIGETTELYAQRRDGTTFPTELSLSAGRCGDEPFVLGIMRDVTERKQLEEQLRMQKDLLTHILNNIPTFVFWKDRNCTYLGCNENFARSAGVGRPEDIAGKTDYDLVWRNDAEAYQQDDKRVIDGGEPLLAFEETQTTEEGGQITLLTSKVPLKDLSGTVVGILGVYTDITERKRTQEEIATLAEFPEENPCPVLRVEAEGTVLYANRAARSVLDLFGTEVGDVLPPQWADTVESVLEARTVTRIELGCEDKTYSMTLAPMPDRGYVNLYALDITGRKIAEQQQTRLVEDLEAINRELNDFAHVVSHDLKAPLRGIHTLADWLMADTGNHLSEESQEHMGLLISRVNRMHNLINGILEYSRVSRTRERREHVNLNTRLADIIDSLAPPEHISIVVDEKLPIVWGEPTRLTQLFQNLISNAIKYMDKEQGLVEVGCTQEPDDWQFFVSDNGPGISDQHFERIFQLFQTLSSKDESESTGVGLTVAKKIVELHGGRLWVASKLGEGTTFFFTLPIREMEESDAICRTPIAAAC